MNISEQKLISNIEECNKHLARMLNAFNKMSEFIPLNLDYYTNISEDSIEHIDQFLFRFSLLQDSMGEKLFRNLITSIGEDSRSLTFIDILNRLEALGLLKKDVWMDLRDLRNLATHEYPDTEEIIIGTLNKLFKNTELIYSIFIRTKDFIFMRVLKNHDQNKYLTIPFPKDCK